MFFKQLITRDARTVLFRLAVLAAAVGSGLALASYLLSESCNVCTAGMSGSALRTAAAQLPWLGMGGALLLLLLSFRTGVRAVRWRINLSLAGGGVGLGLLLLQAVVFRSFCPTCCLVNAAFVLAASIVTSKARALESTCPVLND